MNTTPTTKPAQRSGSAKAAKGTAAPAGRKTAASTRKSQARTTTSDETTPASPLGITHEERWRMIAEAAYHKAEKRGFLPGHEEHDWRQAEAEINALLGPR